MCRWYQSFNCPLVSSVPEVCLFGRLCLHVSGWMGSLWVSLWVWVCTCVGLSLFRRLSLARCSAVSCLCFSARLGFLLVEAVSGVCFLVQSLAVPLPLALPDSLDSMLFGVPGSEHRENTRYSVSQLVRL